MTISMQHIPAFRTMLVGFGLMLLAGCAQQPTYQVVNPPIARTGTVESVREFVESRQPSGLGVVGGAVVGAGLGSLIGGGNGRVAATIVGAVGGGYVGNEIEKNNTQMVYQVGVKYDDGTWGTIRQTAPTGLRIGDRIVVTDRGIEMLRR